MHGFAVIARTSETGGDAMSKIEWCDGTWNPSTGCSLVSPGCANCYARPMSRRLQAMGSPAYKKGFAVAVHEERLEVPQKIKAPTRFFVNSMSDLFHKKIPFAFIDRVMETIRACPQHTFQILTKRHERMAAYFDERGRAPDNAWLGVSAENDKHGTPRIGALVFIPARVRFISVEPLLEAFLPSLHGINWVIVGGESGPGARDCREEWIIPISEKCRRDRVPYFFKQTGKQWAKRCGYEKKGGGGDLPDLRHFRREFPA